MNRDQKGCQKTSNSPAKLLNIEKINFVSKLIGVAVFGFGLLAFKYRANPSSIFGLLWPIPGESLDLLGEHIGLMLVPSIMVAVWSRSILMSIFKVNDVD